MISVYNKFALIFNWKWSASLLIPMSLIAIHAAISWSLYHNNALIPDEILFLEYVERQISEIGQLNFLNLFIIDNAFGYGSLYWIFHHFWFYFSEPWLKIRVFYWILLVASNLLLLATVLKINPSRAAVAILFLLTLPMIWWQGKITGPEPLSHFFLASSIFCAFTIRSLNRKIVVTGLLFGLAAGVKLSTVPLIFFMLAILYNSLGKTNSVLNRDLLKRVFIFGSLFCIACIIGFFAANLFVVISPQKLMSGYYLPKSEVTHTLNDILFSANYFWEVVPKGSLSFFGGSLIIIGIVICAGLLLGGSKLIVTAYLVSIIATILLSMKSPGFFGWYFYSHIVILPLILALPNRVAVGEQTNQVTNNLRKKVAFIFIFFAIVLSAVLNSKTILSMVTEKQKHISQLQNAENIKTYTIGLIGRFRPDLVVDYTEFNLNLFDGVEKRVLVPNAQWIGIDERRKFQGLDWLWAFVHTWMLDEDGTVVACYKIDNVNRVIIMVGDRLKKHTDIWNDGFRTWIEKSFVEACPGWRIEFYDVNNKIHYFVLESIKLLQYTNTINKSPRFESNIGWSKNFKKAVSDGEGVVVGPGGDNPNVLTQRIPVRSSIGMKIVARALSVDRPSAMGRLQINWVGQDGKFISSSGKAFVATTEEKIFETYVVPPTGAAAGYLFVTPHTSKDIVRFTEMRLLKPNETHRDK